MKDGVEGVRDILYCNNEERGQVEWSRGHIRMRGSTLR